MAVEVGIRELRADLSRWLRRVRDGGEIVVTDRGRPVARIVPSTGHRKLDQLIAEGKVTPAKRPWTGPPPKPIKTHGTPNAGALRGRSRAHQRDIPAARREDGRIASGT